MARSRRRTWRSSTSIVVTLALAAVCAQASPALSVTGGHVDGDDHPHVALVLAGGGGAKCSGVLVDGGAHDVVLTAAHCVYRNGKHSGAVTVTFDRALSAHAKTYTGHFTVHPKYDPDRSWHDVAAIRLDSDPGVKAASIAHKGTAENVKSVTVVGYGEPHRGVRRAASERVRSASRAWLFLKPGSGNSCDGDSGAPDFVPGTNVVVALTDLGSCSDDQDVRIDTDEARKFIASVAQ